MMNRSGVTYSLQALRKPLFLAVASGCLTLAGPLPASAGTVLDPAEIFNFNFTNPLQSPPPPYTGMLLNFSFSGAGPLSITFFDDLDGGGATVYSHTYAGAIAGIGLPYAGLTDGIFSVELQSNDLILNSITAFGQICDANCEGPPISTGGVPGTLSTTVPEPGLLALLGIAVAGLAAARRKPRH
jgi:hypothetical protein